MTGFGHRLESLWLPAGRPWGHGREEARWLQSPENHVCDTDFSRRAGWHRAHIVSNRDRER